MAQGRRRIQLPIATAHAETIPCRVDGSQTAGGGLNCRAGGVIIPTALGARRSRPTERPPGGVGAEKKMASVEIRKIDKYFGSVHILHGVRDRHSGRRIRRPGRPSGCGKSTLLRMVAGLEEITEGEIAIGGRVVNSPPKDRDIAMVFQNYALYPHMTVRQNMAFSLKLARAPQTTIEERVGRAAAILGLEHLLDRYPRQLSGGQRQRVAMGRAIVRDPEVFLFDEPLSNLDAKLRVQMRAEIKALHQRLKTTAVYVTHDQIEAMTMADRIVVMRAAWSSRSARRSSSTTGRPTCSSPASSAPRR